MKDKIDEEIGDITPVSISIVEKAFT